MKKNLHKLLLTCALLGLANVAIAEYDSCCPPPAAPQCNDIDSSDSCQAPEPCDSCETTKPYDPCVTPDPCDPCEPCCNKIPLNEEPCNCAYNAPARIDTACGWDAWFSATFLYWQAREKGCEIGYHTISSLETANPIITYENPVNLKYNYHPSFKIGLGCSSEGDDWTFLVEYTRFYSKDKQSLNILSTVTDHNFLNTNWINPSLLSAAAAIIENGQYYYLSGKWKIRSNIIDLKFGRPFYLGRQLTFNPHYGLRGGTIDQKYRLNAKYTDITDTTSSILLISSNTLDSWLIGPRAGIDTNWMLGSKFRVYGNFASSLFYQKFKTKIHQYLQEQDLVTSADVVIDKSSRAMSCITPNLEFELGLGYGTYFGNNEWFLDIALGYSYNYFWNQNNLRNLSDNMRSLSDGDASDLMFHGLTLTVRLDF